MEEPLSEEEIDERVIAQADDPSAWEEPIEVHRDVPAKLALSAELAARGVLLCAACAYFVLAQVLGGIHG